MRRFIAVWTCALLLATACSSDGGEPAANLDPGSGELVDNVDPIETGSDEPGPDVDEDASPTFDGDEGLVTTALNDLPVLDTVDNFQIYVADFQGAADLLGVGSLPHEERISAIGIPGPVSEGRLGFIFTVPETLRDAYSRPEDLDEQIGFSFDDILRMSEVVAPPERAVVITGPQAWGGAAEPHVGDLLTIGQAEDFVVDIDNRGPLDNLGRSVRLAERDGKLGASLSTPILQTWADGTGQRYSNDGRVAPLAAALDEQGVVSAAILVSDFTAIPFDLSEEGFAEFDSLPFITERFVAVGIGGTIRDGKAIEVVAYRFLTDETAEAAMPSVEFAWTQAESLSDGLPISDVAVLTSIERDGPVVTVITGVPEGRVGRALNMFFTQEVAFGHR